MKYSHGLLGAAGLLTLFLAAPAHVYGQQQAVPAHESHDQQHNGADAKAANASEQHPGMTHAGMMKMMSDMKAGDAKIKALVDKMNAATGAEKTDAIAAVVTALVEDCGRMHDSMMSMMSTHGNEQATPKP